MNVLVNPVPGRTPLELKAQWDRGEKVFLLDVRQPEEAAIATLGGTLIPLGELPDRIKEIEAVRNEEVVVLCHHGMRSAHAAKFLIAEGFTRVFNLSGGIDRWATDVDPTLPRY